METISKITDGAGTSYDLAVRCDNIQPIMENSWSGLVASANNSSGSGCDFILGEFNTSVSNWVLEVELDCSYTATGWSNNLATSHHICHLEGVSNSTTVSSMWNSIRSTSYRPFYYFVVYRPSTASKKHYFGVTMYNCNNNTLATNARTITCKVRRTENLTNFSLHDAPANTDYATYYVGMTGRSSYNIADSGLQETGDNNSTTNVAAYDTIVYCSSSATTVGKAGYAQFFDYSANRVFKLYMYYANTANTPTLTVNSLGAKTVYLLTGDNVWSASSSTVKTITSGVHWTFFNSNGFYILPDAGNFTSVSNDNAVVNGQAAYATKNAFVHGVYTTKGVVFRMLVVTANTNTGDLSLNINVQGLKPLYINGTRANGSSNNLSLGFYQVVYDGTNYQAYNTSGTIVHPESTHSLSSDSVPEITVSDVDAAWDK